MAPAALDGRPRFPFSAIVGQTTLKLALRLNAINPSIGGVLIRGPKGAAKSTAARALAAVLPTIKVVTACRFRCDPTAIAALCPDCRARFDADGGLPDETRRVEFVELPVGVSEDRVIGAIDLQRALQDSRLAFEPGLLARANRGLLYIDEVNLLDNHIVDLLLDAAALGVNYVEREGFSISHAAEFVLVGTMNPEEGDLRPQLLDRFGLCVEVDEQLAPADRAEVVRRRIAFERDPLAFLVAWADAERQETERLANARARQAGVTVGDEQLNLIGAICAAHEVDGLRADIVTYKAATALAAWRGDNAVSIDDIRLAAELALRHRRRRQPFESPGVDQSKLDALIEEHANRQPPLPEPTLDHAPDADDTVESRQPSRDPDPDRSDDGGGSGGDASGGGSEQVFEAPDPATPLPLKSEKPRKWWLTAGSRRQTGDIDSPRGRTRRYAIWRQLGDPVAWSATIKAAARRRCAARNGSTLDDDADEAGMRPADLRRPMRVANPTNLWVFVVDASGSMGAQARMSAAKGAVMSILLDAYQRRDQVAMVVFRGQRAELALPPTNSVDLAQRRLRDIPTGGRTPLAHALQLADQLIGEQLRRRVSVYPTVVIISDGRGNVSRQSASDGRADLAAAASALASRGLPTFVIDAEIGPNRLGRAERLARQLTAEYLPLDRLGQW